MQNIKVYITGVLVAIGCLSYVALAGFDSAKSPKAQKEVDMASQILGEKQVAKDQAQALLDEMNAQLDLAAVQYCEKDKLHAKAQLADYYNDLIILSEEELSGVKNREVRNCEEAVKALGENPKEVALNNIENKAPDRKLEPSELFYTFWTGDGAHVSQGPAEHFNRNKLLATDVATGGRKLQLYAPSYLYKDESGVAHDIGVEYTVRLTDNPNSTGRQIELYWTEEGVEKSFWIGHVFERHVKDGQKIKTGEKIGISGGCPEDGVLEEVTSGCHVHIEYRVSGEPSVYPATKKTIHKQQPADTSQELGK